MGHTNGAENPLSHGLERIFSPSLEHLRQKSLGFGTLYILSFHTCFGLLLLLLKPGENGRASSKLGPPASSGCVGALEGTGPLRCLGQNSSILGGPMTDR